MEDVNTNAGQGADTNTNAEQGAGPEAAAAAGARDESVPLTVADVKSADLGTPEGRGIVDRYRLQQLNRLNRSIGYAIVEGKGVIVRVGANGIGELGVQFNGVETERLRLANRLVPFVEGSKEPHLAWMPIFPEWLKWSRRRTYDGIVFRPKREVVAERRLPKPADNGLGPLDLYVGTAWAPAPGKCDLILAHIREVWCGGEDEATEYVLSWLARMVQQPEKAAETVLVLRSGQGIGKGTVTNIFRRYFGAYGIEITNDRELTGFNDHLATSVFISLNEAVWGGAKAAEGTLKSIITDPELTVERKYLPRFKIKNHTHLIVSSNSEWCVPVGHDDRRFVVLNPSEARKGDFAYFDALHAQIEGGGDRALIHWLLRRDISGFNPRALPKVSGDIKLEQKMRSANSVAQWLHGVLAAGGVYVTEKNPMGYGHDNVFVSLTVRPITTHALYDDYVQATRGASGRAEPVESWAKTLRKILGDSLEHIRTRSGYRPRPPFSGGTAQVWCYCVRSLERAREAFARYMGEDIEWPEIGDAPEEAEEEDESDLAVNPGASAV